MNEDWRVRVETPRAEGLLERFGVVHSPADDVADALRDQRLAVTQEGDQIFVYTSSGAQAEAVRALVDEDETRATVEHWLADESRWDDDAPGPSLEEETIARGYAPWEVRVERDSREQAHDLADELEGEGLSVVRRFRYLIVGADTREEAEQLARRLHGEVEPGGELVYEVLPRNPFAFFGGMGGTGTPL